jgi:hypothetical protein
LDFLCLQANAEIVSNFQVPTVRFSRTHPDLYASTSNLLYCKDHQLVLPNYAIHHELKNDKKFWEEPMAFL